MRFRMVVGSALCMAAVLAMQAQQMGKEYRLFPVNKSALELSEGTRTCGSYFATNRAAITQRGSPLTFFGYREGRNPSLTLVAIGRDRLTVTLRDNKKVPAVVFSTTKNGRSGRIYISPKDLEMARPCLRAPISEK